MSNTVIRLRFSQNSPVMLMAAATCAVESLILWRLMEGELSPFFAAVGHLLIAGAIGLQTFVRMKQKRDLRCSLTLFFLTLSTGPAGGVTTLSIAALSSLFSRTARPFEEWYRTLFPEQPEEIDIGKLVVANRSDKPDSVMPLIDVLAFGSHSQKQAVLSLITANFRPAFAKILKAALNDANSAIRVQAATAITKIENDFMSRAVTLSARVDKSPNDLELLKSIARHYDEYAYIGVLDPDRERECRTHALAYYERYIKAVPNDEATRTAAGRLLVRDRQYSQALAWFEQGNDDEGSPSRSIWYLESLFRTGKFDKLRSLLSSNGQEFGAGSDLPLEIVEAARLWFGNAERVEGKG